MKWEEDIMFGINQLKKYQKTKRIKEKEEIRKNKIYFTIVMLAYILLIIIGGLITR